MPYTIETKDNKATVTLTIPAAEVEEGMKRAAEIMSEDSTIPGFRAGKAPYEVVKQRVGEMKLLEAAAEELIRTAFVAAMMEEDLETVGQPFFGAEKMAPGNDMIITAEIALYPHITDLADYNTLKIKKKDTEPTAELMEMAKKDLSLMRTKEARAEKGYKLAQGDKAVINLGMKKDGVVVEGGESQNHGIYTGESYYVEGFIDKIIGMAEDEEKTFTLKFPKEHYQKHLSGQDVDFTVKMNEIFKLETPIIDDEFAKSVGMKGIEELDEKLKENLRAEGEAEELARQDKEALDLIAGKSKFDPIPDLLVNQEIDKMIRELDYSISERGMELDAYLKQIGKTLAEIKLDFTPNALTRVKVALILKEVAKKENITIEDKDVDSEIDRIGKLYEDNKEAKAQVYDPGYRDYVVQQMTNRKAIDFLKGKMVE